MMKSNNSNLPESQQELLALIEELAVDHDLPLHFDVYEFQQALDHISKMGNCQNAMRLLPNQHGLPGGRVGLSAFEMYVGSKDVSFKAEEIFTTFFGEEFYAAAFNQKTGWLNVSDKSVHAKLLTGFLELYCRTLFLQGVGNAETMQPFNWPISFQEKFIAPGIRYFSTKGMKKKSIVMDGLWLLQVFGEQVQLDTLDKAKTSKVFKSVAKQILDKPAKEKELWQESLPVDYDAAVEAVGCYDLALQFPELKVLVRAASYDYLVSLNTEMPANLIRVAPQWMQPFNFAATSETIFYLITKMEEMFKSCGMDVPPVQIGEHKEFDETGIGIPVEFDVMFGDRAVRVNKKRGVWDVQRQRLIGNVLEIPMNDGRALFTTSRETVPIKFIAPDPKTGKPHPTGIDRTSEAENKTRIRKNKTCVSIPAEEIVFLNSYTLFIQGIFQFGFNRLAKKLPEPEQMFDKELANFWHLNGSYENSGLEDGDRQNLERSTSYIRGYAEEKLSTTRFPIRFEWKQVKRSDGTVNRFIAADLASRAAVNEQSNNSFTVKHAPRTVRPALEHFSLVPTNKATFVDSRFCAVQMKHVPEEMRVPMIRIILKQILKDENATDETLLAAVREQFSELGEKTDDQVWEFLSKDIIFCLSSKVNKLVKRTLMADAFVGKLENSEYRGIHRYGQPEPSLNNVLTESLIFCGMPFAPGMALTLGDSQFTLLDRHNGRVQPPIKPLFINNPASLAKLEKEGLPAYKLSKKLEKKRGDTVKTIPYINFVVSDAKPVETEDVVFPRDSDCTSLELPEVDYKNGEWICTWKNQPVIQKGQTLANVPFLNAETQEIEYVPITANSDGADGAFLEAISWTYTTKVGKEKALEVEYKLRRKEGSIKFRNTVKAMASKYFPDLLHMPANDHLGLIDAEGKAAVRTILFRDCNKWLDLIFGPIDIVAATIERNKNTMTEAYACLRTLQLMFGEDKQAHLDIQKSFFATGFSWHPAAALMGYYNKLIELFEKQFGKAVWIKFDEPFVPNDRKWAEGFIACSRKMLTGSEKLVDYRTPIEGWTEINPVEHPEVWASLPLEAHWNDILVLANTSKPEVLLTSEGDKVDVCIFAKTVNKVGKEQHILLQRGWGYVGTPDCPLLQPVKAELSSVRASITTSQVMGGVLRFFGRKDPAFARAMVWEGYPNYAKAGAIYSMQNGISIKHQDKQGKSFELPVVDLIKRNPEKPDAWVITDEAAKYLDIPSLVDTAKNNPSKLLTELAKHTTKVVFRLPNTTDDAAEVRSTIYTPVIAFQDRNGMGNNGSFAYLVGQLFSLCLINKGFGKEGELMIRRLKASLASLAGSKSLAKAASRGRKGAVAKPVALPCIPLNEIWVKQSSAYKSEYQNLIRANGWSRTPGKLHGAPMFFDRAPMPFAALVTVRVITADPLDPYNCFYDLMDDAVRYMNAIAAAYTGGDYDGDTGELVSAMYTVIDEDGSSVEKMVEGIPFLSLEELINCVENRCGRDNLQPGANYYGDYLEILSQAKVAKKRGIGWGNMTLFSSTNPKKSLVLMMERSVEAFTAHVGKIHTFFLICDLYLSLAWECSNSADFRAKFPEWSLLDWQKVDNLIEVLAEIYEVPLAGYDPPAYTLFSEFIFPVLYEKAELSREELIEMEYWMAEAGMNATGDKAWHLYEAALEFRQIMDLIYKPIKISELETPRNFLQAVSAISFLMSKGKLSPVGFSSTAKLDIDGIVNDAQEESEESKGKKLGSTLGYLEDKFKKVSFLQPFFENAWFYNVDQHRDNKKGIPFMYFTMLLEEAQNFGVLGNQVVLSSSEFLGNSHTQMINLYSKFVADHELTGLINESVVLLPIEIYKKTMLPALLNYAPELDCSSFGFSLEEACETEEAKLPQAQAEEEMKKAKVNKSLNERQIKHAIASWSPSTEDACNTFNALPEFLKKEFASFPEEVRNLPEWCLFSGDQWLAEIVIITGNFKRLVVTGRAGSGKTMVSKFAAKVLNLLDKIVWKVGSTGIAAQNMGSDANTLASKFCIGTGELLPEVCPNDITKGNVRKMRRKLSQVVDNFIKKSGWEIDRHKELIIFVDEVSMLSSEILILWEEVIKLANMRSRRNYRYVFFGDFRQLLSVPPSSDIYPQFNNLAFDPAEFLAAGYPVTSKQNFASVLGLNFISEEVEELNAAGDMRKYLQEYFLAADDTCVLSLVTNHRQKSSEGQWINVLNALGDGNKDLLDVTTVLGKEFAKRVFVAKDGAYKNYSDLLDKKAKALVQKVEETEDGILPEALHIYHSRELVAKHNQRIMDRLILSGAEHRVYETKITNPQVPTYKVLESLGTNMLGTSLEFNKEGKLDIQAKQTIAIGQKWMCRQNINEQLKNSTIGIVVKLEEKSFWIKTPYSAYPVEVSAETQLKVDNNQFGEPIANVKGVPGHPAYALTPHKVQGLTILPDAEVPERGYVVIHLNHQFAGIAASKKEETGTGMHGVLYVAASRTSTPEQTFILTTAIGNLEHFIDSNNRVKAFVEFSEATTSQLLAIEEGVTDTLKATVKESQPVVEIEELEEVSTPVAVELNWTVASHTAEWIADFERYQHTLEMQSSSGIGGGNLYLFMLSDLQIDQDIVMWLENGTTDGVDVPFDPTNDAMQATAIAYLNGWQPPSDDNNGGGGDDPKPSDPTPEDYCGWDIFDDLDGVEDNQIEVEPSLSVEEQYAVVAEGETPAAPELVVVEETEPSNVVINNDGVEVRLATEKEITVASYMNIELAVEKLTYIHLWSREEYKRLNDWVISNNFEDADFIDVVHKNLSNASNFKVWVALNAAYHLECLPFSHDYKEETADCVEEFVEMWSANGLDSRSHADHSCLALGPEFTRNDINLYEISDQPTEKVRKGYREQLLRIANTSEEGIDGVSYLSAFITKVVDVIHSFVTSDDATYSFPESEQEKVVKTFSDDIHTLEPNQIFVFGSNTQGRHGLGAAKQAMSFDAIYGQSKGRQGQTYAIVTKDLTKHGKRTVSIDEIELQVIELIQYAQANPQLEFLVTPIGCGLAGYTAQEIKECFEGLAVPSNVVLHWSIAPSK